jgi:hypothetical protein
MPSECLDLMILNSKTDNSAILVLRRQSDVAIAEIEIEKNLKSLEAFRDRIRRALEPGPESRPLASDLAKFGTDLFDFCFAQQRDIFPKDPNRDVRVQLFSNRTDIKAIPWEYIQPTEYQGPHLNRCVIRIVPSVGHCWPNRQLGQKLKILFAASYPIDQERVEWQAVRDDIESSLGPYAAYVELQSLVPADWSDFRNSIRRFRPDVVHFSGHGSITSGETQLFFMDSKTNQSQPVTSETLSALLQERDIRLVVLTACDTSTMPRKLESRAAVPVAAEDLVRRGIRAVVANQLPLPNATAASFVGPLYRSLLQEGDVDKAVAEGRVELFTNLNNSSDTAKLEWGIPTLHRHLSGAMPFEAQ